MNKITRSRHLLAIMIALTLLLTVVFVGNAQTRTVYSSLFDYMNIFEGEKQAEIDDNGNFSFNEEGVAEFNFGLNGEEFEYVLNANRDWNEEIKINVRDKSGNTQYRISTDYVGEAQLKIFNQVKKGTESYEVPETELVAEIIPDKAAYAAYLKEQNPTKDVEEQKVEIEKDTSTEEKTVEENSKTEEETVVEEQATEEQATEEQAIEEEIVVEEPTVEEQAVEEQAVEETLAEEENVAEEETVVEESTDKETVAEEETKVGKEINVQTSDKEVSTADKVASVFTAPKLTASEVETNREEPELITPEVEPIVESDNTLPTVPDLMYVKMVEPSSYYKISLGLPAGEYQLDQPNISPLIAEYNFNVDYSGVSEFTKDISILIGEVAPLVYVYEDSILTDQLFIAQNRILWLNSKSIKLTHTFNGITYNKIITIPNEHIEDMLNKPPVVAGYDYGDAPITYKSGGTYVDYNQTYQLALNNNNSSSNVIIDTEDSFVPSNNADHDDKTNQDDDDSIIGASYKNEIKVNVVDGVFYLNIAYKVDGPAELGVWLDGDADGRFEREEGYIYSITNNYGKQQYQTLAFPLKSTSLNPGDSTFIRLRIVEGSGMRVQDASKDISRVGETEDVKISLYEQQQNEVSQVCNATYTNSNIITIKSIEAIDDGYTFVFDIGAIQNASMTISGDGILSIYQTNPLSFDFQPYRGSDNVLNVTLRDEKGNPLHLPLQWTLSFLNGSGEVNINKVTNENSGLYQKKLTLSNFITNGSSSKVYVSSQTNNWRISGTSFTNDIRNSSVQITTDTVSNSDMSFTQNSGKVRYSISLNTDRINEASIPCNDVLEVDTPKLEAYVQKYNSRYYDSVGLYSKSPFKYVIDNIPVPSDTVDLQTINHQFTMPNNVSFNTEESIKVYRRKAGTGNAYAQIDSGFTTSYSGGVSTLKLSNWDKGYEYRIVYPLKAGANFNKNVTQYLNSKVIYSYKKGTATADLNKIILNGLQAFKIRFALTMSENQLDVSSYDPLMAVEDYGLYYAAKKNCGTCTFTKKLPLTSEGIPLEEIIEDDSGTFTDNTSYKIEIYDDKFKVAQFHVKQWKPTKYTGDNLEEINDNVNPVQHIVYYEKGYEEETIETEYYVGEEFYPVPYDITQVEAGKVEVQVALTVSNTLTEVPSSWSNITTGDLEAGNPKELQQYYIAPKKVNIYIPEDYIDQTLETPMKEIKGDQYKTMTYTLTKYYDELTPGQAKLIPDSSYIIEAFSGRMYNEGYGTLYIPTKNPDEIAAGANDALDDDLRVSDYLNNQFLISQNAPSTNFSYYQEILDFGLNKVGYIHEFEAYDQYKVFGYFENESHYFVKPADLTTEEIHCLKNGICPDGMQKVKSGTNNQVKSIAGELEENPEKINSAKTLNGWIDEYMK